MAKQCVGHSHMDFCSLLAGYGSANRSGRTSALDVLTNFLQDQAQGNFIVSGVSTWLSERNSSITPLSTERATQGCSGSSVLNVQTTHWFYLKTFTLYLRKDSYLFVFFKQRPLMGIWENYSFSASVSPSTNRGNSSVYLVRLLCIYTK